MPNLQAALSRHLLERHSALDIDEKKFPRASLLPWREPTPGQPRHWSHASKGLSDMHPDRPQDVVDKQRVSLVGMTEGRHQQAPESGNREVVDASSGLITQIADSRRVGLVSDRLQRHTRQIKRQRVIGLVEESLGISLQVMETSLASPQVAHHSPTILPIFAIRTIAECQTDEKSI